MLDIGRWRQLVDDYRLRQIKSLVEIYGSDKIIEYEGHGFTAEDHEQFCPEQEIIIKSLDRSFSRIKTKLDK